MSQEHYLMNKASYLDRVSKRNRRLRAESSNMVWDYLSIHPCVDCGESDPVVLEFDHVRGKKIASVSRMMSLRAYTKEVLLKEIAKCDVRCANCHRRQTAARGKWYEWRYAQEAQLDEQDSSKVKAASSNLALGTI